MSILGLHHSRTFRSTNVTLNISGNEPSLFFSDPTETLLATYTTNWFVFKVTNPIKHFRKSLEVFFLGLLHVDAPTAFLTNCGPLPRLSNYVTKFVIFLCRWRRQFLISLCVSASTVTSFRSTIWLAVESARLQQLTACTEYTRDSWWVL